MNFIKLSDNKLSILIGANKDLKQKNRAQESELRTKLGEMRLKHDRELSAHKEKVLGNVKRF